MTKYAVDWQVQSIDRPSVDHAWAVRFEQPTKLARGGGWTLHVPDDTLALGTAQALALINERLALDEKERPKEWASRVVIDVVEDKSEDGVKGGKARG